MKKYKCKNGRWTTRHECRKQLMEVMKTNKEIRENKREGSNITEKMIREDWNHTREILKVLK